MSVQPIKNYSFEVFCSDLTVNDLDLIAVDPKLKQITLIRPGDKTPKGYKKSLHFVAKAVIELCNSQIRLPTFPQAFKFRKNVKLIQSVIANRNDSLNDSCSLPKCCLCFSCFSSSIPVDEIGYSELDNLNYVHGLQDFMNKPNKFLRLLQFFSENPKYLDAERESGLYSLKHSVELLNPEDTQWQRHWLICADAFLLLDPNTFIQEVRPSFRNANALVGIVDKGTLISPLLTRILLKSKCRDFSFRNLSRDDFIFTKKFFISAFEKSTDNRLPNEIRVLLENKDDILDLFENVSHLTFPENNIFKKGLFRFANFTVPLPCNAVTQEIQVYFKNCPVANKPFLGHTGGYDPYNSKQIVQLISKLASFTFAEVIAEMVMSHFLEYDEDEQFRLWESAGRCFNGLGEGAAEYLTVWEGLCGNQMTRKSMQKLFIKVAEEAEYRVLTEFEMRMFQRLELEIDGMDLEERNSMTKLKSLVKET